MMATGGIAIFSFIPVLQLILYLYEDIGFAQTLSRFFLHLKWEKHGFLLIIVQIYYLFILFGLIIEKGLYMLTLELSLRSF